MIASYFESIKYIGHLWPVAIFRIILGYQYVNSAVQRVQQGYLEHASISERLLLSGDQIQAPGLYFEVFKNLVQSQWLLVTYLFIGMELLVGASYILGLGVRFSAFFGLILSLHIYLFFDFPTAAGEYYLFYIHLLFLFLGAGRCLGLDYYFYKSRRGLLW